MMQSPFALMLSNKDCLNLIVLVCVMFIGWASSLLARWIVPIQINRRHGCGRIYCANTTCKASEGELVLLCFLFDDLFMWKLLVLSFSACKHLSIDFSAFQCWWKAYYSF